MTRELGRRIGKEVEVVVEGRDTRVDKTILEKLDAPLTHLVRNALDHGLEPPEARLAAGKPRRGTVTLRAARDGEHVLLEIGDDGRGIDVAAVRRAAVERGVLSEPQAARLSDADAIQLIYRPGLSSRRAATELSGRGYGLDEVETAVRRMRGTIQVGSEPGRGARFRIRIPDAGLGIVPCIRVRVGKRSFLIPREATRLWTHGEIDPETGGPFVDLAAFLDQLEGKRDLSTSPPDQEAWPLKVVLETHGRRLVVGIDEVGQEEGIVARPLPRELTRAPLWSMAAVRGNQDIELVLDVAGLADYVLAGMTAAPEGSGG
jgi:two-component system chemotaxis sensor kinase CheA